MADLLVKFCLKIEMTFKTGFKYIMKENSNRAAALELMVKRKYNVKWPILEQTVTN